MLTFKLGEDTVSLRNQERESADTISSNRIVTTSVYGDTTSKTGFPSLRRIDMEVYETSGTRVTEFLEFAQTNIGRTIELESVTYTGNVLLIDGIEVIEEQNERGFRVKMSMLEVPDVQS